MRNVKFTFSQQEEQQRKDIYGKLQVKGVVRIAVPVMQMSFIVSGDEWCWVKPYTVCCNFCDWKILQIAVNNGDEKYLQGNFVKEALVHCTMSGSTLIASISVSFLYCFYLVCFVFHIRQYSLSGWCPIALNISQLLVYSLMPACKQPDPSVQEWTSCVGCGKLFVNHHPLQ